MQFESIANFSAVIDRLGEFSEVLESSAIARPTSSDAQSSEAAPAIQQSLINLVDQPGKLPQPNAVYTTKGKHDTCLAIGTATCEEIICRIQPLCEQFLQPQTLCSMLFW